MPVRPPPFEIRCPRCGWRKLAQPASDALAASDLPPEACPACGHRHLEVRPRSGVAALWQRLGQWLKPS